MSADSIRGDMGPDSFRSPGSTRTWRAKSARYAGEWPRSGAGDKRPMLMCSNAAGGAGRCGRSRLSRVRARRMRNERTDKGAMEGKRLATYQEPGAGVLWPDQAKHT